MCPTGGEGGERGRGGWGGGAEAGGMGCKRPCRQCWVGGRRGPTPPEGHRRRLPPPVGGYAWTPGRAGAVGKKQKRRRYMAPPPLRVGRRGRPGWVPGGGGAAGAAAAWMPSAFDKYLCRTRVREILQLPSPVQAVARKQAVGTFRAFKKKKETTTTQEGSNPHVYLQAHRTAEGEEKLQQNKAHTTQPRRRSPLVLLAQHGQVHFHVFIRQDSKLRALGRHHRHLNVTRLEVRGDHRL